MTRFGGRMSSESRNAGLMYKLHLFLENVALKMYSNITYYLTAYRTCKIAEKLTNKNKLCYRQNMHYANLRYVCTKVKSHTIYTSLIQYSEQIEVHPLRDVENIKSSTLLKIFQGNFFLAGDDFCIIDVNISSLRYISKLYTTFYSANTHKEINGLSFIDVGIANMMNSFQCSVHIYCNDMDVSVQHLHHSMIRILKVVPEYGTVNINFVIQQNDDIEVIKRHLVIYGDVVHTGLWIVTKQILESI